MQGRGICLRSGLGWLFRWFDMNWTIEWWTFEKLNRQTEVFLKKGEYKDALEPATRALELVRQHRAEDPHSYAVGLNNLATVYRENGRYREAAALLQESVGVKEGFTSGDPLSLAKSLNNLALTYQDMADMTAAEPLLERSCTLRREAVGATHPDFALGLYNLAECLESLGERRRAESLHSEALGIMERYDGKDHALLRIKILRALANLSGDIETAKEYLEEALQLAEQIQEEDHHDYGECLIDLAIINFDAGDWDAAQALVDEALKELDVNEHGEHSRALILSAAIPRMRNPRDLGAYKQSLELLQSAVKIERELQPEANPVLGSALNSFAKTYDDMGDYRAAEPLYTEALGILRSVYGDGHSQLLTVLLNIATLYSATGRANQAFDSWKRALPILERCTLEIASMGSERQRAFSVETSLVRLETFLSFILKHGHTSPHMVRRAFDTVIRLKGVCVDVMATQREFLVANRHPELAPTLDRIQQIKTQLAQSTLQGLGRQSPGEYLQLLNGCNTEKERLECELARRIPVLELERRLNTADRNALAEALEPDAALVEFVRFRVFDETAVPARGELRWTNYRYIAFVLLARDPERISFIDLGDAEPIEKSVSTLRQSIAGQSRGTRTKDSDERPGNDQLLTTLQQGSALRTLVFDPIRPLLGNRKRVILAPDGDLFRLPFEALPIDETRFLIDEYIFSYVSVGRDILRFGIRSEVRESESMVMADPDFNLTSKETTEGNDSVPLPIQTSGLFGENFRFERLPGTSREGGSVARLLDVEPLMGNRALKAALRTCRSPRILHLATHGFFLADEREPVIGGLRTLGLFGSASLHNNKIYDWSLLSESPLDNPLLRSGLALAGANTVLGNGSAPPEAEDGIVTAEDVSSFELQATQLVVLSACETGMGLVRSGQGVLGLRRAFTLAGAAALIMSLWKVADSETQELMEGFYKRLLQGQPRVSALRDAQLESKAKYQDPFYWAAFICEGNPAPLSARPMSEISKPTAKM